MMEKGKHIEKLESPTIVLSDDGFPGAIRVQKCKLLVVNGPQQGREYVIDRDLITVGSGPNNDLVVQDSAVSRRHCEIHVGSDGYVIRDLGSTNGTMVQDLKVTEAFLDKGAELVLGKTRIIFCPLEEAVEYALSRKESFGALVGKSVAMRRVFHLAETYATTDATILIEGETGTGKEVLAEEIHRISRRKSMPFVVIDSGTLAHGLVESELFGHSRGAFTGANVDRTGAFEHADGGTVFLDEVGDLSLDLQPKLLRVLEKREIRRLGSNKVKDIDVRIISATNRKLENEVNTGRFREDLYYRLSIVRIEMPSLRRRKDDIPLLAKHFLTQSLGEEALSQVADFDKTIDVFNSYDWPGNVRELKNLVEIACCSPSRPIRLEAFLYPGRLKGREAKEEKPYSADRPFKVAKNELVREFEEDYIQDLLKKHEGNISRAAREAGIERAYLQRLIRKYGLKS